MEDLSLHILDIAENAIRAEAGKIVISITEEKKKDKLTVQIKDNGKGMNKKRLTMILDPFFTTKKDKRVGLGIPLISMAANQTGGNFKVDSAPGKGTSVTAVFRPSHPDMKPVGNILETLKTLIISNPGIQFIYEYKDELENIYFDSFNN